MQDDDDDDDEDSELMGDEFPSDMMDEDETDEGGDKGECPVSRL